MLCGGYRRQRVYGAPESRPQGEVGGRRRVILARGDSGPPQWPPLPPEPVTQPPPWWKQRWQRKGSRWRGHRIPSSVPAKLAKEWLGRSVNPGPRRSLQAACWRPLRNRPHFPSQASSASVRPRLARQHRKALNVRVISWPPAGAKQCAQQGVQLGFGNKVGCG